MDKHRHLYVALRNAFFFFFYISNAPAGHRTFVWKLLMRNTVGLRREIIFFIEYF